MTAVRRDEQLALPLRVGGTYVFATNYSVGALLGRGMLMASAASESSGAPIMDLPRHRLWTHRQGVPRNWIEAACSGVRNSIPMVLSSSRDVPRRIGGLEYLLIEDVASIVFRDAAERDRVVRAPFKDYDIASLGIATSVDASVFDVPDAELPPETYAVDAAVCRRLRLYDCSAGALCAYMAAFDGSQTSISSLFTDSPGPGRLVMLVVNNDTRVATEQGGFEELLMEATGEVLVDYPPEEGWPTLEILDAIASRIEARLEAENTAHDALRRWRDRALAILNDRGSPPTFADGERSLGPRALMLLLLRHGDVDAIANVGPDESRTTIAVGPQVRQLAMALAGFRAGLRRLPTSIKYRPAPERPRLWLEFLARQMSRWFDGGTRALAPNLNYEVTGPLEGEWTLGDDRASFDFVRTDFDPVLMAVGGAARDHGLLLEGDHERLVFELSGHRVYADVVRDRSLPELAQQGVVTLSCRLRPPRKRRSTSALRARNLPETADDLLELLIANARPGQRFRFGVDAATASPIVVEDVRIEMVSDHSIITIAERLVAEVQARSSSGERQDALARGPEAERRADDGTQADEGIVAATPSTNGPTS